MAGGPPVGDENSPFTFEGLAVLLEHLAEIQGNLPLDWRQWERRRLHGWARWVGSLNGVRVWPVVGVANERHERPRLALALTEADAPVAPEPPPLHAESALRTAPDAAWRSAWRAGWAAGWIVGWVAAAMKLGGSAGLDRRGEPRQVPGGSSQP